MAPDVSKEKRLLKILEILVKTQDKANAKVRENPTDIEAGKWYATLAGTVDAMQKRLVATLDENNRAVLKDFTKDVDKNITHAFGNQADEVLKILKAQNDTIDKLKNSWESEWWAFTKNFFGHFSSNVTDVFDTVKNELKSHFNTIFGPIMDNLVTPLLNIGKSFGKALGLFGKDKNADITANTLLWIKDFYKDQLKRDLRGGEVADQQFPWLKYLGIAMITLGGIIGGLLRRFTMFFEIFKIQKFGPIQKIINFFAQIGKSVGGWLDDAIRAVGKIPIVGKFVSEVMQQFMKFFPAVAGGFKLLGAPLTILLGAIDFIRGFMGTEGNILQKIQGGLKEAVDGFINFPVWILGKAGDWLLSKVGMEIEGGLGPLMKEVISDTLLWLPNMLSNFFTGFFESEESGFVGKMKDGLLGAMESIIKWPTKLIGGLGDWLLGLIGVEIEGGLGPRMKEGILSIFGSIVDGVLFIPKMITGFFTGFFESEEDSFFGKLKDGLLGSLDVFKESFINLFTKVFNWVGGLFDWSKLKNNILNKIKSIPGAGFFIKDDDDKIEHGDKDYTEKGGPGPTSSMPSGRIGNVQDNSFISLLSQIKNILNTKLNQIISILIQGNITSKVVSGMGSAVKSIGSSIGNFLSGKDDKTTPDVKEVVGVGTQLTEVPGATDKDWEDPMGRDKRITSEFGGRIHPVTGKMQGHKGLDMAGPEPGMYGYPIKASKDGVVSIARNLRGYGNVVYVNHDDGYQTRYAHLQDFKVRAGDMVTAGQVIGGMGNTGVGTGPHLHYEVRKDNKALNPKDILSAREGAMIGNQSSEMGIPAEVHPNEAILPLNDSVLSILGEKIAKFISIKEDFKIGKSEGINYDIPYDSPSNNFVKVSQDQIKAQDQISKDFITSIKKAIDGLKDYRMDTDKDINNIMMSTNNNNGSNEPPDQIENGLLLIMNSGWGVT